jgi:hypothetical protein
MRKRQRHLNQRAAGATLVLDSRRITGLSDGSAVGQWNDVSGSGWNVTQSDNAKKPTYKTAIQGGQPIVRSDGGDRLISSSVSTTQTFSTLLVFQRSSSDTDGAVVFDSYNDVGCVIYTGQGTDSPNNFSMYAGGTEFKFAPKDGNWKIVAAQFSGATSFAATNGVKSSASSTIGTNGLSGISIFDVRGNPNPLNSIYSMLGDIAQVILIASSMLDPLRKRLEHSSALSFKLACS